MQAASNTSFGRRQFLRAFGAGVIATAAVPPVLEAKADSETNDEKRKPRYRESDHVKAFYRVSRYPT
jgi:hypothetical protein